MTSTVEQHRTTIKRFALFVGAIYAMVLMTAPAQAAPVSFILDQSNSLADGTDYLKVTIDDEDAGGAINFTVQTLPPLSDFAGSNYGIQKFSFNGAHLESSNILFTGASASGWQVVNNNGSMNDFGKYSNVLAATGNHRADPLTFSIVGIAGDGGDYVNGNPFFAAHVAGFRIGCVTSAYFGGGAPMPVPSPGAAWLFGSGLIGLAAIARRQSRGTSPWPDRPPDSTATPRAEVVWLRQSRQPSLAYA